MSTIEKLLLPLPPDGIDPAGSGLRGSAFSRVLLNLDEFITRE